MITYQVLLLVIISGGLMGSAMHVVWGLLTPLGALVVYGPKAATRCFAGYVGVLGLGTFLSYNTTDPIKVLESRTDRTDSCRPPQEIVLKGENFGAQN